MQKLLMAAMAALALVSACGGEEGTTGVRLVGDQTFNASCMPSSVEDGITATNKGPDEATDCPDGVDGFFCVDFTGMSAGAWNCHAEPGSAFDPIDRTVTVREGEKSDVQLVFRERPATAVNVTVVNPTTDADDDDDSADDDDVVGDDDAADDDDTAAPPDWVEESNCVARGFSGRVAFQVFLDGGPMIGASVDEVNLAGDECLTPENLHCETADQSGQCELSGLPTGVPLRFQVTGPDLEMQEVSLTLGTTTAESVVITMHPAVKAGTLVGPEGFILTLGDPDFVIPVGDWSVKEADGTYTAVEPDEVKFDLVDDDGAIALLFEPVLALRTLKKGCAGLQVTVGTKKLITPIEVIDPGGVPGNCGE